MTDTPKMPGNPRVIIQIDEHGNIQIYQDTDVDVFAVDELCPNDRIYRYDPTPIPDGILDGEIGHYNDGSPAMVRAIRAVKDAHGISHLSDVTDVTAGDV